MRKTRFINLNASKFVTKLKKNYLLIIFSVMYVVGVVLGSVWLLKNNKLSYIAAENFSSYIAFRTGAGFFKIFFRSFCDMLPVAVLIFLCGTSLFGMAVVPIAVCYKGFEYGIFVGYIYNSFLLKGIAFNALMLIPYTIVSTIGYIKCADCAFGFSCALVRASVPTGGSVNLYTTFREYCKRFSLFILFFIFSAAIDSVLSVAFINFFSF